MAKETKSDGPWMFMVHKDFKDRAPARVTRRSFELTWKGKGWTEFSGTDKEARSIPTGASVEGGKPEEK